MADMATVSASPAGLDAVARLTDLADYTVPFAVRVVADLGVADVLAGGPQPVDVLAERVGAHRDGLHRTLRVLAARGIFTETGPGVYALTPLAEPLRADHPLSLKAALPLLACEVDAWARCDHTVATGEAAFDRVHGRGYWEYLAAHRADAARVDAIQAAATMLHLRTMAAAYPWGRLSTVVDVGGGNGTFLAGLLARHRNLHGTLLDLPHVVEGAPEVLAAAGVADRCAVVGGSFFDGVPAGADAYVLKTVLPGWTDARATDLLRAVRAGMRPDSVVLALEAVPPAGDAFDVAKLFDVQTLVMAGAAHRSRDQLVALFGAAGLAVTAVTPTPTLTIVEARPADGVAPTNVVARPADVGTE
jgi:hypothetical protein